MYIHWWVWGVLHTQEGEVVPSGCQHYRGSSFIPRGHVWLEGDNPVASYDSRHHGAVPLALIYGKVLYKVKTGSWVVGVTPPAGN